MLQATTMGPAADALDDPPDPTACDRCAASLERGWSERWRDDKRVEAVCFGCDEAERLKAYIDARVITTKLMIRAAIEAVRRECGKGMQDPESARALAEVKRSTDKIHWIVKEFERRAWFGGLQAQVLAAAHRGFRATFGATGTEFCVLVYSLTSKTMITIESADESQSISIITTNNKTEPIMGIQGICATETQAIAMLTGARAAYESGMRFDRNDKVWIL